MNKPKTKSSVEHKTNVLVWGYIIVMVAALLGLGVAGLLTKDNIERTGLNLLGDFAAGFFAPLAFIGLFGAFYLQREQLVLARKQNADNEKRLTEQAIAEENAANLNLASIQANYKLGLYDKRKAAFDRLVGVCHAYTGKFENEMVEELQKVLFDARFVFPEEIYGWIDGLLQDSFVCGQKMRLTEQYSNRHYPLGSGPSVEEQNVLIKEHDEIQKLREKIFSQLVASSLWERFEPYMGLPEQIEFQKVTSRHQRDNNVHP